MEIFVNSVNEKFHLRKSLKIIDTLDTLDTLDTFDIVTNHMRLIVIYVRKNCTSE